MSRLQSLTKPVLLPLLLRQKKKLGQKSQETLATWITMFSMVFENANPKFASTTQDQRLRFKTEQYPQKNWLIWLAPFSGEAVPATHIGFQILRNREWPMVAGVGGKAQVIIAGAGGVCFVAYSASSAEAFETFSKTVCNLVEKGRFTQIWPCNGLTVRVTDNRTAPVTWEEFSTFSDALNLIILNAAERMDA